MFPRTLAGAAFGLAMLPALVTAAEFNVEQYDEKYEDGPGAYIEMSGEVEPGDYYKLLEVLPKAIALHGSEEYGIDLWLSGPGGDLDEALKIGKFIFDLNIATMVDKRDECASACALIWLGGSSLLMHPEARIGFHQAYVGDGEASIAGNAMVGHYLSEVGLDASVAYYVVAARPEEMAWLTPRLAASIDLPVVFLED